jgi:hypothetical protein
MIREVMITYCIAKSPAVEVWVVRSWYRGLPFTFNGMA